MSDELYRLLPQVDEVLRAPAAAVLTASFGRSAVHQALREELHALRLGIAAGQLHAGDIRYALDSLTDSLQGRLENRTQQSLRRVVNGTGVLLHTNLGRAPLAPSAIQAIEDAARGFSTLEYNLERKERGSRQDHVRDWLTQLTGAEDAFVVNNNAGAVLLVLSALTKGREVIVSRGELVEVGGSFRIPEIIEQGGARLKEVGSTNKTHLGDYERAIVPETAALLKVHTSNYRIIGFTAAVETAALVQLAQSRGLLAICDLGSGVLVPDFGEPTVREAVKQGLDVVTFSGDKLMGGPQAGVIVGKREHIDIIKRHPLARALRIDKLTLAALEATLRLYRCSETAGEVPLLRMFRRTCAELQLEAESLAAAINNIDALRATVVSASGQMGGGAMPEQEIPSVAVAISSDKLSSVQLEEGLRKAPVPVIARLVQDEVWVDMRTLLPGDADDITAALTTIAGSI
ncbi:MAG: L-seryl-tRNA(Sec) selenium transferase [Firmicutes bacterium]|nr:L-seryl-tRNA(Sec) selenium transferase [Bacillota bacterium]